MISSHFEWISSGFRVDFQWKFSEKVSAETVLLLGDPQQLPPRASPLCSLVSEASAEASSAPTECPAAAEADIGAADAIQERAREMCRRYEKDICKTSMQHASMHAEHQYAVDVI